MPKANNIEFWHVSFSFWSFGFKLPTPASSCNPIEWNRSTRVLFVLRWTQRFVYIICLTCEGRKLPVKLEAVMCVAPSVQHRRPRRSNQFVSYINPSGECVLVTDLGRLALETEWDDVVRCCCLSSEGGKMRSWIKERCPDRMSIRWWRSKICWARKNI